MIEYDLPIELNNFFDWLNKYISTVPYITNSPIWFETNNDVNEEIKNRISTIKNLYECVNVYATDNHIKQYQTNNGKYYYLKIKEAYYIIGQGYSYTKSIMIFLKRIDCANNYIDYKEIFKGGLENEKIYVKK